MSIKKIRESITLKEYTALQEDLKNNTSMRPASIRNLSRAYCNCFYTGIRINENQGTTGKKGEKLGLYARNILELFYTGSTKFAVPKQKIEKRLFLTDAYAKDIVKYFDLLADNDELLIAKGSNETNRTPIHPLTFIGQVNAHLKKVLGSGYTSHSFRQGLISEMLSKGANEKAVQRFIGHRNLKQTVAYYEPSNDDIKGVIVR